MIFDVSVVPGHIEFEPTYNFPYFFMFLTKLKGRKNVDEYLVGKLCELLLFDDRRR